MLVFKSNLLHFSLYILPSSKINISKYTEDLSAVRHFLAKLARCGYIALFKFHHFKILSYSVSAFKFSIAKYPYISTLTSSSIDSCCSSSCVAVFNSILNLKQKIVSWKLLPIKIYRGFWFVWRKHRRTTFLISLERERLFNINL